MAENDQNGGGQAPAGGGGGGDQMVPLSRLNEVISERNEARAKLGEYEKQIAEMAPLKTRLEELGQEIKAANEAAARDLAAARLDADRLRAAVEAGLPVAMANRLAGATLEELAADAAKLAPLLRPAAPGVPPAAPPTPPPAAITAAQLADPKWVRENQDRIREAAAAGGLPQ